MASALVDVVVGKLGEMIIEEINKEASLTLDFRNDFEWLSQELKNIRGYLRDADLQSAHKEPVKDWLLRLAEIAWDAEDIVEEIAVESQGTNNKKPQSSCACAFSCSQLAFLHKMSHRIKDVKDRMKSIVKVAEKLKLCQDLTHSDLPSTSASQSGKGRGSSLIESDSRSVAIESKVADVLCLLDDPGAPVIAVVGMGGIGKTFLLQHVFNKGKSKFEKAIWLAISQNYSLKMLQADLASEINLSDVVNGKVSEEQAAKLIYEHLERVKCLIVLEDVLRVNGESDLISALGLPRGDNCKIMVTTRSRDVCDKMKAHVYEMQPLSQQESWKLFCTFAFPNCHQNQPPTQLEGIARKIEAKCGRLPLAVKTVAASLAGKISSREWKFNLRQLRAQSSTNDPHPIMQILKLSYDSLPAHLKPCFAFLSFFPEDGEIDPQYLINLWVAEGYVPEGEEQLDIGWSYICHLHSLCLLERVGDIYDHLNQKFKLHDLLLDLVISISKEFRCAFSVKEAFKKGKTLQKSSLYRRILLSKKSISCDDGSYDDYSDSDEDSDNEEDNNLHAMASKRAYSTSCLRTLSFSQNRGIENIPAVMLSAARVLRVLDLSFTNISSLPTCVGKLKLLKVLNLRGTQISKVPECVKSNKSLRLLDISWCKILEQLPEWIGELNCLGHLDICGIRNTSFNKWMPKGISRLVSLQVLRLDFRSKLSIEDNEFLKLEDFVKLSNLHQVRIDIHHEIELKSIKDGILANFVKMRNLVLCNHTTSYVDACNLPPLSEEMLKMRDLEFLELYHFAVPNWIWKFSNLVQITLRRCHCVEYPALEMVPNLIKLILERNKICKALPKRFGMSGGFPHLRYFRISQFNALEELPELEDGAMPCLEILEVFHCSNLKKVSLRWELLKSLKKCRFRGLEKKDEELWNKMKAHNFNVTITSS